MDTIFYKYCHSCKSSFTAKQNLTLCTSCSSPSIISLADKDKPSEDAGQKFDTDKPPMELLSFHALVEISQVFGKGATKYGRFNYRGGIKFLRIGGAAARHLFAWMSGEDKDPETGLSHMAHVAACAIMALDMIREHPMKDDRYKK